MFEAMKRNLEATGIPIAEFMWRNAPPPPYAVWAQDGTTSNVYADGKLQESANTGTVDLYSTVSKGIDFESIENALNCSDVAWYLNSVQYEENTGLVHYEWVWGTVNG